MCLICIYSTYLPSAVTLFMLFCINILQDASPEPTVISSSGDFTFTGRYKYTGTRDYTAFATVPAGLQFIAQIGGMQQMRENAHTLAITGAKYLSNSWNTSLLVILTYLSPIIHILTLVFCYTALHIHE